MTKIYTKTGDTGSTGIAYGVRLSKADKTIELLGSVDEISAIIGILRTTLGTNHSLNPNLRKIQEDLWLISGIIADYKLEFNVIERTKELENQIDFMNTNLKPLNKFIFAGDINKNEAITHFLRARIRSTERIIVGLVEGENPEKIAPLKDLIPYFNRLSDHMFTIARYISEV